ncbi:MAG: flagellar biosynthetic protein FliO [Myxococcota bacterium]|nr:flagellar biosynthetic protein FliO [Myxococcota bacterium]
MLIASQPTPPSWQAYGVFILETLVALAVVAVVAWAIVRFGLLRWGLKSKSGRMKVIERLPLDARRSVYLVEVDGHTLLIGAADTSVHLIKEINDPAIPTSKTTPRHSKTELS